MNTIFVTSTTITLTKTHYLRRFSSSTTSLGRQSTRNQNTAGLAVSYTNIEKALANSAHNVSFSLEATKPEKNTQSAFRPSKALVEIANPKIATKSSTPSFGVAKGQTYTKNARAYRVNRVFLRRVRRFRLESRRFSQLKTKSFNRTKALVHRTSQKDLNAYPVSSKTTKQNLFGNNSALAIAGTSKARTVYQGQTQPVGLYSAARVLSLVTNTSVSVHRINGLTLARLGLDREKAALQTKEDNTSQFKAKTRGANSGHLLAHLRETTGNRLGTSPAAVPDLVRLPFTALYVKAAPALAERLAHGLRTLPRQRKETAFLRSLLKLVKVLTALRPERLGLRIRLQGRVNRWRRTKHIVGERGHLPLYTYNARRESGTAQAITRKGAVGLRVWLAYRPDFAHTFRRTLLSYFRHQR